MDAVPLQCLCCTVLSRLQYDFLLVSYSMTKITGQSPAFLPHTRYLSIPCLNLSSLIQSVQYLLLHRFFTIQGKVYFFIQLDEAQSFEVQTHRVSVCQAILLDCVCDQTVWIPAWYQYFLNHHQLPSCLSLSVLFSHAVSLHRVRGTESIKKQT